MEIFDDRIFSINKAFMDAMGLWPYSSRLKKYSTRFALAIFIICCYLPQFIRMRDCFGRDLDQMFQTFAVMLYLYGISIKIITAITAEGKMRMVYEITAKNFQVIVDEEERNILFKYGLNGRNWTILFMGYMAVSVTVFVSLPMGPIVLDHFVPLLNGTRERIFIWNGNYLLDTEKHYYKIYAFESIASIITVAILAIVGPMYQAVAEHSLALFAIIQFRLKTCTRATRDGKKTDEEICGIIVKTIKLHREIVHFTRIIEAAYSTYFLMEMGITVLLMSFTSVTLISKLDKLFDSLRHIMIIWAVLIHMFYLTWPSQKIINHSTDIFLQTYSNEWYTCSIKCQNLLKFMALRCVEPSQFTAGGLYSMNFENYASLVKTSASYITLLLSFR